MANLSENGWRAKLKQLMQDTDYDLAEEICFRRLRENPDDSLYLTSLGRIAWEKGDRRDAIIIYRKATQASSENIEAWVLLSGALIDGGSWSQLRPHSARLWV